MESINAITNNRFMQKHGLKIAWAVALVCLLWLLVHIGMTVRSSMQSRASNYSVQKIKPVNKSRKAPYQVGQILGADLFGDPSPAVVVKEAPKTTLDLTLHGILSADDSSIARAIIQRGRQESVLYSIGETIKGAGAEIKEIRTAEVILDRNGAAESLPLLKETTSGNREIISYEDEDDLEFLRNTIDSDHGSVDRRTYDDHGSSSQRVSANDRVRRNAAAQRRARSQNAGTRGVRKPNFSGLDRALKKLGEI